MAKKDVQAPDEADLRLEEQEDGTVVVNPELKKEAPPEEDAPLSAGAEDEESGEEQGHAEETPEEAAERRERNRKRRAETKERRKEYIEGLKRESEMLRRQLDEQNQRLAVIERKSSGSEMAQLETAEKEAVQYYNHFKQLSKEAIERADGAAATEAQESMFAAKQRYDQIQNIKKAMQQRQQQPQPLDPRLASHAQDWMSRNNWYDPSGRDMDSKIVLTIDHSLAQAGWDPTTKEYWQELDKSVQKFLPHRAKSAYNPRQDASERELPRIPVSGSGRDDAGPSTKEAYKLSASRVQALKDAGMWDDPAKRAAMIKRYQQMDKEARK